VNHSHRLDAVFESDIAKVRNCSEAPIDWPCLNEPLPMARDDGGHDLGGGDHLDILTQLKPGTRHLSQGACRTCQLISHPSNF
jgi:hypothetical protein